ncbi:DNA repair protein xrcc2 [Mactra antiquata]
MASKETGIQFLARLGSRPTLSGIEPILFGTEGPHMKDVIEIFGEEGTGKTEMLVHLICRCILPEKWNNIHLGGRAAGVILFDTDSKFSILRLVHLLEKIVSTKMKESENSVTINSSDMDVFIGSCLKRLKIVLCYNSDQLFITLHSVEDLILNDSSISVIMIDSISSFYWMDRQGGGDSTAAQESNMRNITEILNKLVEHYNLTVLVSKSPMFKKKNENQIDFNKLNTDDFINEDMELLHSEFLCKSWQRFVTHRLVLVKLLDSDNQSESFIIGGDCCHGNKKFLINNNGICFMS